MDKRSRKIIHEHKPILSNIDLESIKLLIKDSKIFTKAMFDDIFGPKAERDFYDELCTRGPDAFKKFTMILKSAGHHKAAVVLQNKVDNKQNPPYYKMDSVPYIGYCLIIMNQKFGILDDDRGKGCQVDADALKDLFKKLKYDVDIEWDKEANEMESILKKFSKKSELINVDSCIVYILSHGDQCQNLDYIKGTDGERVYKKDICSMFNNINCKLLIGKPKIFFFQACRGKVLDYGVSKNPDACDANLNAKSQNCDACDEKAKSQNSSDSFNVSSPPSDKNISQETKYTDCSDMFIIHSSLPDHKSWKNNNTGSWLCQDLVTVVSEYYDRYDLATMMAFVNCKQIVRESADGCKQITHTELIGPTALLQFKRS